MKICPLVLLFTLFLSPVHGQENLLPPGSPAVKAQAQDCLVYQDGLWTFHFRVTHPQDSDLRAFDLPLKKVAGKKLQIRVQAQASLLSARPAAWNGVKVMVKIETPDGISWPQLNFPAEDFPRKAFTGRFTIPGEATAVHLILGLEKVAGEVNLDSLSVTAQDLPASPPPVPASAVVFKGHPGTLRGAMVSPQTIQRSDFDVLTKTWGANLARWQLVRSKNDPKDFASYDHWLDTMLVKLDQALVWAQENHTYLVVDLHSPPGGGDSPGGYQDASGELFTSPQAQDHFVAVWEKIAAKYKDEKQIWGFDLVNEPNDSAVADGCLDWHDLALRAGKAVRKIDPQRTLVVEPNQTGGADGFRFFPPLDLDHVVYSFHFYTPGAFTHQGVFSPSAPVTYPGPVAGETWDKGHLEKALKPALDFARRYRVQMYVGEFGAVRWAPGAEKYLADLIELFEAQGWDWSYHAFREWQGWSVELGSSQSDPRTPDPASARLLVVQQAFQMNQKALSQ